VVKKDTKRKRTKRQSSQPDLMFPARLCSQDPAGGNPFSEDNPLHQVWRNATIHAEQELHEAIASYIKMLGETPQTGHPNELFKLTIGRIGYLLFASLDAWAYRDLHVVLAEDNLKIYDHNLGVYAESWLAALRDHLSPRHLRYLRLHLSSRVELRKSDGRKRLIQVQEHFASQEAPVTLEPPPAPLLPEIDVPQEPSEAPFTTDDYQSINYRGENYPLTSNQRAYVRKLHQELLAGRPWPHKTKLLAAIGSTSGSIGDSFRGSPLWRTLIVLGEGKGLRGHYRLDLPDPKRKLLQ